MKIHNIRVGFATNSSSTHSMAFMPNESDRLVESEAFGWEDFVAASSEAKAKWLAYHLMATASHTCGGAVASVLAQHWLGFEPHPEGYLDHQSRIRIPNDWNGKGIDAGFFKELRDFVLQPGLVVLGGNDNEDCSEGDINYRSALCPIVGSNVSNDIVARKDSRGYWTVFDRTDGAKFRVSFGNQDIAPVTDDQKSDAPELIDVKITDHCPFECSFCYQGSTKKGQHAQSGWIYNIQAACARLKVFEVALGGGEPTLHPDFVGILQGFRRYGVVPNFTTRNMAWLRDPEKCREIMAHAGSWAFSTENPEDIGKLHALLVSQGYDRKHFPSVQYIIGVGNPYAFESVVKACQNAGFKLTLLGAKDTGRGKEKSWERFDWIKVMKEATKDSGFAFGIDTALVQQYRAEIKKARIPEWCYHTHEGKFSMYIDAVEGKISPSSYCQPEDFVTVDSPYGLEDAIVKHYSTW